MAYTILWTNVIHAVYSSVKRMPVAISMAQRCYKPEHVLMARTPGCILLQGEAKDLMARLAAHSRLDPSVTIDVTYGTVAIINAMRPQSLDVIDSIGRQRGELFFPLTDVQLETLLLSVFDREEFERFESVGSSAKSVLLREKLRFLNGLSVEQFLEIESRSVARRLLTIERDLLDSTPYTGALVDIAESYAT